MKIRILDRDDLDQLLMLYSQLNHDDPLIDSGMSESIWNQSLESEFIDYVGLFDENWLLSACQILVVPNLTRGGHPYCLIENVVTHVDYRNKGYGKQVLEHTIGLAWQRNCYKVMLMSGRKQESVNHFYKSVGFSDNEKQAYVIRGNDIRGVADSI